jgi:glycosyltransferase involved in cell wall biosynthesis
LDEQLEVLCITYNRAGDLDRTLGQLAHSPLARCRITVLDNASTDATPEVCARREALLERLHTIRHPKNIGLSANYLHAIELATAPYTWVICDDDHYDFGRFGDVAEALRSGEFDLVSLGSAGTYRWVRGIASTTAELRRSHPGFHFVSSFIPSLIFRTALFDSNALSQGYRAAGDLFPHFPFLNACVAESRSLYIAREPVLFRNDAQNVLSPLQFLTSWVNNCSSITDRQLRRQVVFEAFELGEPGFRWRFASYVAQWIAYERLEHPERVARELGEIAFGLSRDQLLLLAPLLPIALIPRPLLRALRTLRARLTNVGPPQPFMESQDRLRL